MRTLCLLLLSAAALAAQPIGFGVKAGIPMNDFLSTARSGHITFDTNTNRYIIGPSVELRLPFGLGIEFDALYRHFSYSSFGADILGNTFESRTTSGAWEFPLVAKYRFKGVPLIHPFVEGGVSWDRLSGVSQTLSTLSNTVLNTSSTSNPAELHKDTVSGFVLGGGVDFKLLVIHIVPEVRYTRWGSKHFNDINGLINSNQNQGEFLVGFKF